MLLVEKKPLISNLSYVLHGVPFFQSMTTLDVLNMHGKINNVIMIKNTAPKKFYDRTFILLRTATIIP